MNELRRRPPMRPRRNGRTMSLRYEELSFHERGQLDDANPYACDHYEVYRRRGMSIVESFTTAITWGRNTTEQRERDYAHETGAQR